MCGGRSNCGEDFRVLERYRKGRRKIEESAEYSKSLSTSSKENGYGVRLYKRLSIQRLSGATRLAIRGSFDAYRAQNTGQGRPIAGQRAPLVGRLFDCLKVCNGSLHVRFTEYCTDRFRFSPFPPGRMLFQKSSAL